MKKEKLEQSFSNIYLYNYVFVLKTELKSILVYNIYINKLFFKLESYISDDLKKKLQSNFEDQLCMYLWNFFKNYR